VACAALCLAGTWVWRCHFADKTKAKVEEPGAEELQHPQAFIGLGESSGYAVFGQRIHQLGRDLPGLEQRRLIHWIENPKFAGFQDSNPGWHWLVNEVMTALSHQNAPLPGLTDCLVRLANDSGRDMVIRDYALQHMVDWLQPIAQGEPYETNPAKRQTMVGCLLRAAQEERQSFSGTAVLGLHLALQLAELRAKPIDGEPAQSWRPEIPIDSERLQKDALRLVQSPSSCDHARISAFQVCAQRGFADALPIARKFAGDTQQPNTTRLSAIAALGALGNSTDSLLLDKIQKENRARLAKGIETAANAILLRANSIQNQLTAPQRQPRS
jgi:hypothetical protein